MKCIEDEIPFEVPKGWAWTRLGNLCAAIQYGLSNSAEPKGSHKFLRITDIQNGMVNWDAVPFTSTSDPDVYLLEPGDIVFARTGATVGKSFLITETPYPSVYASYLIRIRLLGDLPPEYIYQFFDSACYWSQITDKSVGVGQPNCNGTALKELFIPLPPINEQLRIIPTVRKLLKHVTKIDTEEKALMSIVTATKAKILDLAIRGQLVPQNSDNEPASVLLERIREEKEDLIKQGKIKRDKKESSIFKGEDNSYYEDIPKNWVLTTLSELTHPLILNDGDWILSENMSSNGSVKLIRLGSIGEMQYVDKGFKYITEETFTNLRCTEIHSGYILINRIINEKMNICILPNIEGKLITAVDACWISPNNNYNLKYIMYALSSPTVQLQILLKATGTTRKRISKHNLINIPIPFPPLDEQNRIVEVIEKSFTQLNKMINCLI